MTPEGNVLFNTVADGTLVSLSGLITGDPATGAMALFPYLGSGTYGPVSTANVVVAPSAIAAGSTYFLSDVGSIVLPAFTGGTLQVDADGLISTQNFTLDASGTNRIDQRGNSATFSGVLSDAVPGTPGGVTIANSETGGRIVFSGVEQLHRHDDDRCGRHARRRRRDRVAGHGRRHAARHRPDRRQHDDRERRHAGAGRQPRHADLRRAGRDGAGRDAAARHRRHGNGHGRWQLQPCRRDRRRQRLHRRRHAAAAAARHHAAGLEQLHAVARPAVQRDRRRGRRARRLHQPDPAGRARPGHALRCALCAEHGQPRRDAGFVRQPGPGRPAADQQPVIGRSRAGCDPARGGPSDERRDGGVVHAALYAACREHPAGPGTALADDLWRRAACRARHLAGVRRAGHGAARRTPSRQPVGHHRARPEWVDGVDQRLRRIAAGRLDRRARLPVPDGRRDGRHRHRVRRLRACGFRRRWRQH